MARLTYVVANVQSKLHSVFGCSVLGLWCETENRRNRNITFK